VAPDLLEETELTVTFPRVLAQVARVKLTVFGFLQAVHESEVSTFWPFFVRAQTGCWSGVQVCIKAGVQL
jgi:hypothetical protein